MLLHQAQRRFKAEVGVSCPLSPEIVRGSVVSLSANDAEERGQRAIKAQQKQLQGLAGFDQARVGVRGLSYCCGVAAGGGNGRIGGGAYVSPPCRCPLVGGVWSPAGRGTA